MKQRKFNIHFFRLVYLLILDCFSNFVVVILDENMFYFMFAFHEAIVEIDWNDKVFDKCY
jgi:hypothetical protein